MTVVSSAHTNQKFLFWDETEKRIIDVLPKDHPETPPIFHPASVSTNEPYLDENDVVVVALLARALELVPL